ncbi:TPA: hypothetical protein EYP70_07065 [Candidatus Bathyarchaeota archaeon]|nr:hypothetical protein [Candidatus Bathyarchaeota archaeon]
MKRCCGSLLADVYYQLLLITMPMVYISKEAEDLLKKIEGYLKKNIKHGRVLKADILLEALKSYAKNLGLEVD